jgi:WD40 repeat protein
MSSTTTTADFVRQYTHALASDFARDGVPASFAPGQPRKWSTATNVISSSGEDITALAASPSGTRVALAVQGDVRIYDSASLALECTLQGHVGHIDTIEWHPTDENTLLSGSDRWGREHEALVRLCNLTSPPQGVVGVVETAAKRAALDALSSIFSGVQIENELDKVARGFATTLREALIRQDVRDGRALTGSIAGFGSRAFSASGDTFFYLRRKTNTVVVRDITSGSEKFTLQGHSDSIMWVGSSPDESLIASSSWDKTVRLWNAHTGGLVRVLEGGANQSWAAAWSPDGALLAAGNGDRKLRIWEVASGMLLHTFADFPGWVRAISFAPLNAGSHRLRLAAGSGGNLRAAGCLRVFDVDTDSQVTEWRTAQEGTMTGWTEVSGLKYSDDGKLAFKGPDDRLLVYDAETNVKWEFVEDEADRGRKNRMSGFTLSAGGKRIWSGDMDGALRGWDLV